MPKLRNAKTDVGKLAQWIGRKCRNHNPLEELSLSKGEKRPNIYKAKSKGDLFVVNEQELVYKAGNRAFAIAVREITDTPELDQLEESKQLEPVGY